MDGVSRVVNEILLVLSTGRIRLWPLNYSHYPYDGLAPWPVHCVARARAGATLIMPEVQGPLLPPLPVKIPYCSKCLLLEVDGRNCVSKRALLNNKWVLFTAAKDLVGFRCIPANKAW